MAKRITAPHLSLLAVGIAALLFLSAQAPSAYADIKQIGSWEQLQGVPDFNPNHQILLTDGSVLFADNGRIQAGSPNWYLLRPDSHGSYVTGTWSKVASMPNGYAPANAASAVLPDGRVIVAGGDMNGTPDFVGENYISIYDPVADTWTMIDPPNGGKGQFATIADAPSVSLADGTFMFGPSGNGSTRNTDQQQVALLDLKSLTWKIVNSTGRSGMNPEAGFNLLPNGKVLTIPTNVPDLKIAETLDLTTGTWSSQPLPVSLVDPATAGKGGNNGEIGPSLLMPDGKLFAEGSNSNTAIYDTKSGTWSAGPSMPVVDGKVDTAIDAPNAILPDGKVLMELSPINPERGDSAPPAHFFIFDGSAITQIQDPPADSSISRVGSNSARMLVLPTGQVLFNGRMGPPSLYIYNPTGKPKAEWLPKITSVASGLKPGNTYTITGTQLSGLTPGSNFGDDWNPNSNYPIVQITNNATGEINYGKTFDTSSYSVAPGSTSTTKFVLPPSTPNGPSKLRVIASGFASDPVVVTIGDFAAEVTPTPSISPSAPSLNATPSNSVTTIKASTPVKVTITCVKGSSKRFVSGVKPSCPPGFKKK